MSTLVAVIAGVFGIVALVAVTVAYFRVNLSQATIATLKESNAALTIRNGELDTVISELTPRVAALEVENRSLRSALGGKAEIDRISVQIDHHHEEVMSDRRLFEDRFTSAMLNMGEKLDSNRQAIGDALNLLGAHRHGEGNQ